ncbi:MAG: hypothetical protein ACLTS6_09195 [Anaerobutyricum sp.]
MDGKSVIAPIDDKAFFDKSLMMYSESKTLHVKILLPGGTMSDDWKERCQYGRFGFQGYCRRGEKDASEMDERLFELKARLLDFAGDAVCLPPYERPGKYFGIQPVLA